MRQTHRGATRRRQHLHRPQLEPLEQRLQLSGGTVIGPPGLVFAVAVQPTDQKIVEVGRAIVNGVQSTVIARYNPDGSPDTSFGSSGVVSTVVGLGQGATANAIVIQPDGKIVVAGEAAVMKQVGKHSSEESDLALVRYNTNGSLDTTFGGTGEVITQITSNGSDSAEAVGIEMVNGVPEIVAAERSVVSLTSTPTDDLVRYNLNGSLDKTFGSAGEVAIALPKGAIPQGHLQDSLAFQPNGQILIGGAFRQASGVVAVGLDRYNVNGSLDTTFGSHGIASATLPAGPDYLGGSLGVGLEPSGQIVVATSATVPVSSGGQEAAAVFRFNANGSLDTTFGAGAGSVVVYPGTDWEAESLAIQSNGQIILAGNYNDPAVNGFDLAVARLNTDGSIDTTYGTGGFAINSLGTTSSEAKAVAIQADGKVVAAGYDWQIPGYFLLDRFNVDGSIDTTF